MPNALIPVYLLLVIGVPMGVAFWIARVLQRQWCSTGQSVRHLHHHVLRSALIAAYAVTAVFGVPATLSQQHSWAVAEYNRIRATGSPLAWDAEPYIHSYAAIPVVPGVVLSYHEYQLAGLYGFGGLELSLWYGIDVKPLYSLALWVS
jgi:hypothetical protein